MESAEMVKVFKALACEKRLRIVKLLLDKNRCVGALAKELGASQSSVSQHLRVLRETGIVQDQRCGYHIHYTVERELFEQVVSSISTMLEDEISRVECPKKGTECANQRSNVSTRKN